MVKPFLRMMDSTAFRAAFPRQLRFWTLHCLLNALPSLIIALGWMKLSEKPAAVAGVFSGIATFILLYATLTSLKGPLRNEAHLLSRSLHLGTRMRAAVSFFSLFALTDNRHIIYIPDTWCGMGAGFALDWIYRTFVGTSLSERMLHEFLPTYAATVMEGILLSFLLLMISFFALVFVQARDRREAFPRPD